MAEELLFDFYTLRIDEKKLCEVPIVTLDLETTGLYASIDEIIEIGMVKRDPISNEIEMFNSFVKPHKRTISDTITKITGIVETDLINAPHIEEIIPQILRFIDQSLVVIHNAEFDISFLKAVIPQTGWENLDIQIFDTLKFSRKILDSPKHSLEYLVEHYELGHERHHRAIDDALMCLRLFDLILDKGNINNQCIISELLK